MPKEKGRIWSVSGRSGSSCCLPNPYPLTQPQLLEISWFSSIKYEIKEVRRDLTVRAAPKLKLSILPTLSCSSSSQINLKEEGIFPARKSSYLDHHLKGEDSCKYIIQVFQSLSGKGKCVLGEGHTQWNNPHRSEVKYLIQQWSVCWDGQKSSGEKISDKLGTHLNNLI